MRKIPKDEVIIALILRLIEEGIKKLINKFKNGGKKKK